MKICVTSQGQDLKSKIDPRFGRCYYFLVLNEEGELVKSVYNPGSKISKGAGIKAAQSIVDEEIEVVITGKIGPNASSVLQENDIKIYIGLSEVDCSEAFEMYKEGSLEEYIN